MPTTLLKNAAGVILYLGRSIRQSVSLCIPKKPCEHHISKTNEGNFTQFWSHVYLAS